MCLVKKCITILPRDLNSCSFFLEKKTKIISYQDWIKPKKLQRYCFRGFGSGGGALNLSQPRTGAESGQGGRGEPGTLLVIVIMSGFQLSSLFWLILPLLSLPLPHFLSASIIVSFLY